MRSLSDIQQQIESHILGLAKAPAAATAGELETLELIDSNIFDSLSLIEFVMHIERLAGIKVPGEDIVPENFGSVRSILQYLRENHGFE